MKIQFRSLASAIAIAILVVSVASPLVAQGIALRGVGSINESMAGAGTAAPLNAAGAIHWNPASIADFHCNQAELGFGMIYPDSRVSSTVGRLSGSSRSEAGASPLPTLGLVTKSLRNPRITTGIGVYAIAGFKLNYDASLTNPILMPQGALGPLPTFGRLSTGAELFQIAPTVAIALNDCWAVGFAPTLTLAGLDIQPLLAAAPGAAGYSLGSGSRYHFGGGGQAGLYFKPNQQFSAGLTVKSEQYFEDINFKGQDNLTGAPVNVVSKLEYPLIVSAGTAIKLWPNVLLASDVRWFNYADAAGILGSEGLNPDGSLAGLGWDSVFSIATGLQVQMTERLTLRGGYVWNENPISDESVFVNTAAPLHVQHLASLGFTVRLRPNMALSAAYLHAFDEAQSGLYAGVPGTDVTIRTAAYLASTGVTIDF